jgi:hypothetical protein
MNKPTLQQLTIITLLISSVISHSSAEVMAVLGMFVLSTIERIVEKKAVLEFSKDAADQAIELQKLKDEVSALMVQSNLKTRNIGS